MWLLIAGLVGAGGFFAYKKLSKKDKPWIRGSSRYLSLTKDQVAACEQKLGRKFDKKDHRIKIVAKVGTMHHKGMWAGLTSSGSKAGAYTAWNGKTATLVFFTDEQGNETTREIRHECAHAVLFSSRVPTASHHALMRRAKLY